MPINLKSLDLFVRVAALGAIGKAGAEIELSPTNATQRIQALETEFDVKLLNRTTRAVSLTPDGEVLLEHARRILDDVENVRRELSNDSASLSGQVRVTASTSLGRAHIVPFVPEFVRAHPEVSLELDLTDSIVDIVEQGYDLAFRIGDLEDSTLLARRIADNPQWLVATPDYLARAGTPSVPHDLSGHVCLPMGRARQWQLRGGDGTVHPVRISGPVTTNLGDAIGEWVLAGLGIGLASLWHAGPDLRAGRLVAVLPDFHVEPDTGIWAVRPPGRRVPARVEAFLDFMQERIVGTNRARYGDLARATSDDRTAHGDPASVRRARSPSSPERTGVGRKVLDPIDT